MKYNAIVVDDELKLQEVLIIKLQKFCPEINILGTAQSVPEAIELIEKSNVQILFLDISMPGESGFDLIEKIQPIDFEVIFVTGFSEFGIQALKISAVDYLLKPVATKELINAVEKAKMRISQKDDIERFKVLRHNLNSKNETDRIIAIPSSNSYEFIKMSQIIRLEGWEKYTRIHLLNGDTLISSYNIGVFKEMLGDASFFSPHKSHLINPTQIKRYLKEGVIEMNNGDSVPVSRRKKESFLNTFIRS